VVSEARADVMGAGADGSTVEAVPRLNALGAIGSLRHRRPLTLPAPTPVGATSSMRTAQHHDDALNRPAAPGLASTTSSPRRPASSASARWRHRDASRNGDRLVPLGTGLCSSFRHRLPTCRCHP